LLLLKAGGRTVYFGDIGKDSHVLREYLAKHDEDRLSGGGEFAKEADDVVGGLTVKTGSRLVEEQQDSSSSKISPTP
jgi:ATP-binding cassette subfamily G (WHITE) protein 2 (SNQ2)